MFCQFCVRIFEDGMPFAFFTGMNALREYGRLFAVYLSFIAFLAAEVAMIYFIYQYLGVI